MDVHGNLRFSWVAVVAVVTTPILLLGVNAIPRGTDHDLSIALWLLAAFLIPFVFATVNFRYWRTRGFTPFLWRAGDFERFYLPAWRRSLVWFLSAAAVGIFLRLMGVQFYGA